MGIKTVEEVVCEVVVVWDLIELHRAVEPLALVEAHLEDDLYVHIVSS